MSAVCDRARSTLDSLGRLSVVGEVSNFTPRNHWYFSIKDQRAVLGCVMWESAAARAAVQPTNGMEVVVTGRLTYYPPAGRTQLVVESIQRRGQGTLRQRFEELCTQLRALGYFEEARKRPLPAHPRRVAVVTARHGAALQDVRRTALLRAPFVPLLVVAVPVQGEGAAPEIARALRALDRRADELGVDAIILTRGGGSLEDLWAFNERVVAEAIYACTCPVVAAIGHETDVTVAELVADRRASTPTQAVMLLLPDRVQMEEQIEHLAHRMILLARKQQREASRTLAQLQARLRGAPRARLERAYRVLAECRVALEHLRPSARHALARRRVAELHQRMARALSARHTQARTRLEACARHLAGLGPQQVLARGYSLTLDADGRLVRRAQDVRPGMSLVTRLAEGSIRSTVDRPSAD